MPTETVSRTTSASLRANPLLDDVIQGSRQSLHTRARTVVSSPNAVPQASVHAGTSPTFLSASPNCGSYTFCSETLSISPCQVASRTIDTFSCLLQLWRRRAPSSLSVCTVLGCASTPSPPSISQQPSTLFSSVPAHRSPHSKVPHKSASSSGAPRPQEGANPQTPP